MQALNTDPEDYESSTGYVKVGSLFWSSSKQSVVAASTHNIEICQEHTDLNNADLLTKTSLTSKT